MSTKFTVPNSSWSTISIYDSATPVLTATIPTPYRKPMLSMEEVEARLIDTESRLNQALKLLEEQTKLVTYLTEVIDEEFKK